MKHLAVLVLVQSWQDPGAFRGCTTHTLWGGSNSVITPGPRRATCGQPESVSSHNDNLYLYHFFHPFHLLIVNISKTAQQLCNGNRLPDCPLSLQIFTWNGYDMLWQRNNQSCHAESNHSVGHTIQVRISASVKMRWCMRWCFLRTCLHVKNKVTKQHNLVFPPATRTSTISNATVCSRRNTSKKKQPHNFTFSNGFCAKSFST